MNAPMGTDRIVVEVVSDYVEYGAVKPSLIATAGPAEERLFPKDIEGRLDGGVTVFSRAENSVLVRGPARVELDSLWYPEMPSGFRDSSAGSTGMRNILVAPQRPSYESPAD